MQKLNLEFAPSQILKAASLNTITGKVDELVDEVNKLPSIKLETETNTKSIQQLEEIAERISSDLSDIGVEVSDNKNEIERLDKELNNQALSLELEQTGDLAVYIGKENTEFQDAYISDNGDIVFEFNFD